MKTTIQTTDISELIVCHDCDLLFKSPCVDVGYALFCPRCGCHLCEPKKNSINRTLALSITALLLYLPASLIPLMTFDTFGFKQSCSVFDAVIHFYDTGYLFVSLMVALTSLFFPLIKLLLIFVISMCLKLRYYPDFLPLFMRWHSFIAEWEMLDVYMIGILVTIIKMYHAVHIQYEYGFFFFTGLLIITFCSSTSMDKNLFWSLIEEKSLA